GMRAASPRRAVCALTVDNKIRRVRLSGLARQPQPGFLEYAAADQHVVGQVGAPQNVADLFAILLDLLAAAAMDHGVQVVSPCTSSGAPITVADKRQRADGSSKDVDFFVVDIPDGHAVVPVAQRIVIWHGCNAAYDADGMQPM